MTQNFSDQQLKYWIENDDPWLLNEAQKLRRQWYGDQVYVRGLIEFSNYCKNDCYYCGIRCGNNMARRYRLTPQQIFDCCREGYELGFRTFVLQSGEDPFYDDDTLCRIVSGIKERHLDCAVTLSVGEKERKSYQAFFDAGADRYLLREETADDTLTARADLINRIIALGQELYIKANGKSQRAHYKRDIYVCKNFTTYLFRQNRDDFCMAEYPDVQLLVPNNLSAAKSKPYSYGIEWEDISPEKGNPFYIAAQFKYDKNLSEEENMALACDFMRQAQRGDYFQMSAKYEYGTGAHSAIMLGYDPETDEIHWMDSNMRGGKKKGIRYGLVQFDEVKSVAWWASTFCKKTRGATLYRLRDDIVYRPGQEPENTTGE